MPSGEAKKGIVAPTQPPTGLRDLYPADLNRLRFIQDAWRRTSINHGFEEIDGPTFEDADLYAVKSGEGILNEVFGVFSGKSPEERARLASGGNAPFALRPEFTPTLARMYAARAGGLPKPTKWFWTQNCFRAERPQRGRLREFYQWNCDIVGLESDEPEAQARADAECIATCVGLLESLGLQPAQVQVRLSNRALVAEGVLNCLQSGGGQLDAILALLDKRGSIASSDFAKRATELGLDVAKFDEWINGFQQRTTQVVDAFRSGSSFQDATATLTYASYLIILRTMFELICSGLGDWCKVDFSIVRGLNYYTGAVFEVHEISGSERAIAGGGRYDELVGLLSGPRTPAVGFGMGDVVLSLVLQDRGLMPSDDEIAGRLGQRPDVFVVSNGTPEADAAVAPVLGQLRKGSPDAPGLHARRSYKATKNVGKLIQDAAKARARYVLIVESEATGQLKDMDGKEPQEAVELVRVREIVSAKLSK